MDLTTKLLPEMWLHIFSLLPIHNLCSVSLTCLHFHHLASDPLLWSKVSINKRKFKFLGVVKFLTIPRFRLIKTLDLSDTDLSPTQSKSLLSHLPNLPSLTTLDLDNVQLSSVPPSLLAGASSCLQSINLAWTRLTLDQSISLLSALSSSSSSSTSSSTSSRLSILSLNHVLLTSVPAPLLAGAIIHLQTVLLGHTSLCTEQVHAIATAILDSAKLTHLSLDGVCLDLVGEDLLARAVARLTAVNLENTKLKESQVRAILSRCLSSKSLKQLNLSNNCLAQVDTDLLCQAVTRLDRAELRNTKLTTGQTTRLVGISGGAQLDLGGVDLVGIPQEILASYKMRGCMRRLLQSR